MRIESIYIKNFKGIEELELNLDPRLNILIGDNGSGKTAILEALVTATGSLFIGMRDVSTKGILQSEVRFSASQEYQFPVVIRASGSIEDDRLTWSRERNSLKGSTTTKNAHEINDFGRFLDNQVREGSQISLPLISYFSTGRLFIQAQPRKTRKKTEKTLKEVGSRFRGYRQSLDAKSNFKRFTEWFQQKELSQIQRRKEDIALRLVKNAIVSSLPGCTGIFYDFDPDTNKGLTVELEDGRSLPFNYLSDGMRSFTAMIADIAHRCVLLNPHLGELALKETRGIVLVDELDLHLHPSWQKIVVKSLLDIFPKLQFIATTHSPFIIQETDVNQLIILEDCEVKSVRGASNLSIEDIAEYIQGVEMPQWSMKKTELYNAAAEYFKDLKEGKKPSEAKELALGKLLKPYSQNPAFDALIDQESLKKNNE